MRRKKEEEQVRSNLVERNQVNTSTISVRTSPREEELAYNWDYEFAKAENEYLVIDRFRKCVEGMARKIIDELGLVEGRRQHKPV